MHPPDEENPSTPIRPAAKGSRWRSPNEPCSNCGDPTPGRFCPSCGQRKTLVQVSVGTIVGEVLKDELALNSSLPRTLVGIVFRPGYLTNEYIRGRVVRYIPPLRLYLISSVVFFLVLSLVSLRTLDRMTVRPQGAIVAEAVDRDSAIAALREQRMELLEEDTLPAGAGRFVVRQMIAGHEAQLQALGDTVTPTALGRMPDPSLGIPGTMQPWAEGLLENVERGVLRRPVERKLAQIGHLPLREATRAFIRDMLEYAPHTMFVLLPVFALILKLLYVRRSRFYAEHFVFALHLHAFFYLMFLLMMLLWQWSNIIGIILLWMVLYVWLAMKRVYQQGWFRTTLKWWTLGFTYMGLLMLGLIGLALSTFLIA